MASLSVLKLAIVKSMTAVAINEGDIKEEPTDAKWVTVCLSDIYDYLDSVESHFVGESGLYENKETHRLLYP